MRLHDRDEIAVRGHEHVLLLAVAIVDVDARSAVADANRTRDAVHVVIALRPKIIAVCRRLLRAEYSGGEHERGEREERASHGTACY